MITYRHFGDAGDIIAGLPVIRHLWAGVPDRAGLLYLEESIYSRVPMNRGNWRGLDRILKEQPYIGDVLEWRKEQVAYNLNDWRARLFKSIRMGRDREKSLLAWQLEQYGIPMSAAEEPWIKVQPNPIARVAFNRTGPGREPHHIYQNQEFPWHRVWRKYKDHAVFVGTKDEHEVFCGASGEVPHIPTQDLYEAAQVIAGCELFVGNQSVCFWLACAMRKPIVLEVWRHGPNCNTGHSNIRLGWDRNVELPEL